MKDPVSCVLGLHQAERSGCLEKVEGFEKPRRGGGANQIVLRSPLGVYACWECVEMAKKGFSREQEAMF